MTEAKLYYEVHLTFDPLVWQTDLYWNVIKALDKHHFRLASLTMASGRNQSPNGRVGQDPTRARADRSPLQDRGYRAG
jgi:hypothetical protein